VVLVSERLEGGPVSSRVRTFPDVSAWRKVDQNARRVVENQGFDGDCRLESLVTMRSHDVIWQDTDKGAATSVDNHCGTLCR